MPSHTVSERRKRAGVRRILSAPRLKSRSVLGGFKRRKRSRALSLARRRR